MSERVSERKSYSKLSIIKPTERTQLFIVAEGYVSRTSCPIERNIDHQDGTSLKIASTYINLLNQNGRLNYAAQELNSKGLPYLANKKEGDEYATVKITAFNHVASRMIKALRPGDRLLVAGTLQLESWQTDLEDKEALNIIVQDFWITNRSKKADNYQFMCYNHVTFDEIDYLMGYG